MKRILLLLTVLAVVAPSFPEAQAVSFETARGNIYSAGGSIDVTENASNDIVAAGGHVLITGSAGNEVLAAGGSVTLSGKTAGDARIAGGNITIIDVIGGEAVLAGGKINLLPKAMIGNDLIAAAGDITIDGTISGSARIIGGTVTINGTISNDADVKAENLLIGKNAVIKGKLRYEAPTEARIERGAVIAGGTRFIQTEFAPPRKKIVKIIGLWWIAKLIAILAACLVIYLAFTEKTRDFTSLALSRFGRELIAGFIILVAVPVVSLLLFLTVAGSLLGVTAAFLYTAFVMLSTALGAVVFSGLLNKYLFKKDFMLTWPSILLGVPLYQLIGLIPFFGWVFKFVFYLSALGALSHLLYGHFKATRSPVH